GRPSIVCKRFLTVSGLPTLPQNIEPLSPPISLRLVKTPHQRAVIRRQKMKSKTNLKASQSATNATNGITSPPAGNDPPRRFGLLVWGMAIAFISLFLTWHVKSSWHMERYYGLPGTLVRDP